MYLGTDGVSVAKACGAGARLVAGAAVFVISWAATAVFACQAVAAFGCGDTRVALGPPRLARALVLKIAIGALLATLTDVAGDAPQAASMDRGTLQAQLAPHVLRTACPHWWLIVGMGSKDKEKDNESKGEKIKY